MGLIEILYFNSEEFKISEGEIKVLNIFYNEKAFRDCAQDLSLALWNVH